MFKESSYLRSIKNLLYKIHDVSPVQDSLYEQASDYFEQAKEIQQKKREMQLELKAIDKKAEEITDNKKQKNLQQTKGIVSSQLKVFNKKVDEKRIERHREVKQICNNLLELAEGQSFQENNSRSARLLGTLFMLTPEIGRKVRLQNMFSKHIYKATLALRLLDQLVMTNDIIDPYVTAQIDEIKALGDIEDDQITSHPLFRERVKIPVIFAALVQDIGRMHPDAQLILKGEDGKQDEFRVLEKDERQTLLKTTFQQALLYMQNALGADRYTGNSQDERAIFNQIEKDKLAFAIKILKSSLKPQNGIGNILKLPQVYASIALTTKQNQPLAVMPKMGQMLTKGAEQGMFSAKATDALLRITGNFPQGFGVAFIPKEMDKRDIDKYEYAVVNRLYPDNPDEPIARCVTRNLEYNSNCPDFVISKSHNLYFEPARKAFEVVSPERLLEILSKLVSNFEERKNQDLVPRCWHTYDYFSDARHQNLWNNMPQYRN
ncbi:hypothetical protein [Neptunicella marina]|uniref:Uncharacterized protein n=1 Tax=Neptunicella marina TaxID=2125989 RepID=A0A8J6LWR3_9ALTE|nr:hypothetical protein [Neptunicella marina]MBC3765279.1 hypothetical protein [Neptunicella marina]